MMFTLTDHISNNSMMSENIEIYKSVHNIYPSDKWGFVIFESPYYHTPRQKKLLGVIIGSTTLGEELLVFEYNPEYRRFDDFAYGIKPRLVISTLCRASELVIPHP